MIYELYEDSAGGRAIKRTDKNGKVSYIPEDETNSDYQAYLKRDEPQVEHLTEIPTPDEA